MASPSNRAATPGYEKGLVITSIEGMLAYRTGKFFWMEKIVDWSYIEYQTFGSILRMIKMKELRVARPTSRETRLIERNKRKYADATGRLLSPKHS